MPLSEEEQEQTAVERVMQILRKNGVLCFELAEQELEEEIKGEG